MKRSIRARGSWAIQVVADLLVIMTKSVGIDERPLPPVTEVAITSMALMT